MQRIIQNRSGYTLLELMVVVAIIGVLAAIAAPSVGRGMRERRKIRAASTVVRSFQAARAAAIASGATYLVRYDPAGDANRGNVSVYRGTTNRCNTTAWTGGGTAATPSLIGSGCAGNLRCVRSDSYEPQLFEVVGRPFTMHLSLTNAGEGELEVCYDGNGIMSWRTDQSAQFSETPVGSGTGPTITGGFTFKVEARVDDDADPGVVRRIVVPLGGIARVIR